MSKGTLSPDILIFKREAQCNYEISWFLKYWQVMNLLNITAVCFQFGISHLKLADNWEAALTVLNL